MLVLSQLMPYYITIQEAEQRWEAVRLLDLERKPPEASSKELQREIEGLEKLLRERVTQVSATAHICIGSSYDTPQGLHLETFLRGSTAS